MSLCLSCLSVKVGQSDSCVGYFMSESFASSLGRAYLRFLRQYPSTTLSVYYSDRMSTPTFRSMSTWVTWPKIANTSYVTGYKGPCNHNWISDCKPRTFARVGRKHSFHCVARLVGWKHGAIMGCHKRRALSYNETKGVKVMERNWYLIAW